MKMCPTALLVRTDALHTDADNGELRQATTRSATSPSHQVTKSRDQEADDSHGIAREEALEDATSNNRNVLCKGEREIDLKTSHRSRLPI